MTRARVDRACMGCRVFVWLRGYRSHGIFFLPFFLIGARGETVSRNALNDHKSYSQHVFLFPCTVRSGHGYIPRQLVSRLQVCLVSSSSLLLLPLY